MAPHPLINKPVPEFSIPDANGPHVQVPPEEQGLASEEPIALFFYPEAGKRSPIHMFRPEVERSVATREACQFRDALVEKEIFKRTDVQVIGISPDPVPKQKQFVESQNLTVSCLENSERHATRSTFAYQAFHVGKGLLGFADARTTFVIDNEGIIRDSLSATMNYNAHVKFVVKALGKLSSSSKKHDADAARSDDPSSSQIRDELGRVAYVAGA
ncbi:thioredoxin-like protein [Suillus lakei]|nr:thioredoxin-like protein [Suillus lakei]